MLSWEGRGFAPRRSGFEACEECGVLLKRLSWGERVDEPVKRGNGRDVFSSQQCREAWCGGSSVVGVVGRVRCRF